MPSNRGVSFVIICYFRCFYSVQAVYRLTTCIAIMIVSNEACTVDIPNPKSCTSHISDHAVKWISLRVCRLEGLWKPHKEIAKRRDAYQTIRRNFGQYALAVDPLFRNIWCRKYWHTNVERWNKNIWVTLRPLPEEIPVGCWCAPRSKQGHSVDAHLKWCFAVPEGSRLSWALLGNSNQKGKIINYL